MSACDPTTPVEFRDIPECEGYTFGSDGSIWSFWGKGARSPGEICRPLKPRRHKSGHLHLRVKISGEMVHTTVHQMICWAFHGPCPPGLECCHKDGVPDNNVPDNLYWGTRQQNIDDQIAHGAMPRGERNGKAIFTEDEVREIRRLYAEGLTCRQIAASKGRSRDTIKAIVGRFTWKHVV